MCGQYENIQEALSNNNNIKIFGIITHQQHKFIISPISSYQHILSPHESKTKQRHPSYQNIMSNNILSIYKQQHKSA